MYASRGGQARCNDDGRRRPRPAARREPRPDRIIIATDCGMKYLPRASAEGKMRAMAGAASILRAEL